MVEPLVIPMPRKLPHPGELLKLIRKLVAAGAVSFSTHAFEDRSGLRSLDFPDALEILRKGFIKGDITPGINPGEWKCKMVDKLDKIVEMGRCPSSRHPGHACFDYNRGVGRHKMTQRAEFCIKGAELLAEPYHYVASGLPNIYLLNGVSHDDTPYGEMVTIKNLNGLHRAIGLHIIEKQEQMTGTEFRFLRKQIGLTQVELADMMRVTDQTVANYEKGNTEEFGPADAFMRMAYFLHIIPDDMRAKIIRAMAEDIARREDKEGIPDVSRLKMVGGWREHLHAKAA